ncbi:MAG: hypothetical protein C7B44_14915 [Sulfobacillus thermosulfidooxidans]|nr:MAG: hypothetical protein C7B44_14915 [Sulfobacillus thermosulfidooxidans]
MNRRFVLWASSVLSVLLLGGCGQFSAVSPTPPKPASPPVSHSVHVSQVSAAPSLDPVQTTNQPESATARPAQPTVTPISHATVTTTVPSPTSLDAATASPFNPVVQQALAAIQGHTVLPLAGPRIIPTAAYAPTMGMGFLTAQTVVGRNHWTVHLRDTTENEPVNSPEISQVLSRTPFVGSFGIRELSSNVVGTNALDETTLRQFNPLWNARQGIINATGKETLVVGPPHAALMATAYGFGHTFNNAKLIWNEGDWTLEITGGSPRYEQNIAYDLVRYLHAHYLPPYTGLIMVDLIHPAPLLADTAVTHIDWIDGRYLMHIDTRIPSYANPVAAATMATTWYPY